VKEGIDVLLQTTKALEPRVHDLLSDARNVKLALALGQSPARCGALNCSVVRTSGIGCNGCEQCKTAAACAKESDGHGLSMTLERTHTLDCLREVDGRGVSGECTPRSYEATALVEVTR